MFDFKETNILITGGSRGIGRAIVNAFATSGANVAFIYGKSVEEASQIEDEWKGKEVTVKGYQADIADFETVKNVIKDIVDDFKKIDVLVNNAGITKDGYMMFMTADNWKKVLDVNLSGTFNVIKQLLPHFLINKKGKIINMTSVGGMIGMAGQTNYSASKAGIIGLTKSLTKEVAGKNINVNCIAPGYIETDINKDVTKEEKEEILKEIPLEKTGEPKEIAKCVNWLVEDNYTTGQIISINGGWVIT